MDPFSKHAAGLASFQGYLGPACPVFTWNKQNFQILPGTAMRGKDLKAGGFRLYADLKFTCLAGQFTQATGTPAVKEILQYLGNAYRINAINYCAGGQQLRFECDDAQQGA